MHPVARCTWPVLATLSRVNNPNIIRYLIKKGRLPNSRPLGNRDKRTRSATRGVEGAAPYNAAPTLHRIRRGGVPSPPVWSVRILREGTEALPYNPAPTLIDSVGAGALDRPKTVPLCGCTKKRAADCRPYNLAPTLQASLREGGGRGGKADEVGGSLTSRGGYPQMGRRRRRPLRHSYEAVQKTGEHSSPLQPRTDLGWNP